MSKSVPRVYLGKPYDRELWWNTARRILNENHRGKHDHVFTRNQPLPDGATKGGYMVGGVGTNHVLLRQAAKYKAVSV